MKISTFVVAVIILGVVVTGLFSFLSEGVNYYGANVSQGQLELYESLNSTLGEETWSAARNSSSQAEEGADLNPVEGAFALTADAIGAVKLPFKMLSSLTNAINDALGEDGLGMPAWFGTALLSILAVVVSFLFLSALFKWNL